MVKGRELLVSYHGDKGQKERVGSGGLGGAEANLPKKIQQGWRKTAGRVEGSGWGRVGRGGVW